MEFIKVLNNEKDIYSLSRLATEIVREHYDPIIGKEQNDYMLKKFQSVEGIKSQFDNGYEYYFLYLKDENQNIGFIGLCEEKKKLFLSKFYIKKEHRNKGYGKQAFEFIKNLLPSRYSPYITALHPKNSCFCLSVLGPSRKSADFDKIPIQH